MTDVNVLEKLLGNNLSYNEPLKNHANFGVGGVADFFYVANSIDQLVLAVSAAVKENIPYFVLGGGYNVVPSDGGFPGLVVLNKTSNIVFPPDSSTVIVDSGVSLGRLINLAAGRDLGGFEFLSGVPGTIGGAIYGNAGAFDHEISEFLKSVTVLIPDESGVRIERYPVSWMNFSYRSSRLKEMPDETLKPVILTATLQLVQRRKDEILRLIFESSSQKRKNQPLDEVSAGSFFKNPGIGRECSAGFLLEKAGAKQMRVGGAAFSKKHANFLINRKNATASDIYDLAQKAKESVKHKFDLLLEEEVEYIGKW